MIAFLSMLLSFAWDVLKRYLAAKDEAAKKQQQVEVNEANFRAWVQDVISKQRQDSAAESHAAGNAWDAADNASKDGQTNAHQ